MRITIKISDITTCLCSRKLVKTRLGPTIDEDRHGIILTGTPHEYRQKVLVNIGITAVRIVNSLDFRSSSAIVKALENGSLFSDVLKEIWRYQLESYQTVSFREEIGEVSRQPNSLHQMVSKDFATFDLAWSRKYCEVEC